MCVALLMLSHPTPQPLRPESNPTPGDGKKPLKTPDTIFTHMCVGGSGHETVKAEPRFGLPQNELGTCLGYQIGKQNQCHHGKPWSIIFTLRGLDKIWCLLVLLPVTLWFTEFLNTTDKELDMFYELGEPLSLNKINCPPGEYREQCRQV